MSPDGILTGRWVVLRPAGQADVDALLAIRREPSVAERWGPVTRDELASDVVGRDALLVIEHEGRAIGAIQFHEEEDPMYRHAGIDLFLDTAHQGRGLGIDAIRTLARYLIHERGHHRLSIDPAADNLRAIRAYERVGFRPVGVLRAYERGPDGTWHDGLLMDLLAHELIEDRPAP
jgi:aminoglycoside 6'-N-acetyltransferase